MSDSIDRKPEDNTKEAIAARLGVHYNARKVPKQMETFSDLPTWVRTAAAYKYLLGLTWKDAAEKVNRKPNTVQGYTASPAFQQWKGELEAAAKDPKVMAEMVMKAHAAGITLDYLAAFQKSIDASDHRATASMAQDILDRIGITKKDQKQKGGASILHITIQGGANATLDVPMAEADWEEVSDESRPQALLNG